MSLDLLVQGRLRGTVATKTAANGNPYAIFKLAAADKNGASILVSCITWEASAIDMMGRLADGDSVAVSGEAAISTWRGNDGAERHGLDVTAHLVMTPYHAGRKRRDKPKHEPADSDGDDFQDAGNPG